MIASRYRKVLVFNEFEMKGNKIPNHRQLEKNQKLLFQGTRGDNYSESVWPDVNNHSKILFKTNVLLTLPETLTCLNKETHRQRRLLRPLAPEIISMKKKKKKGKL